MSIRENLKLEMQIIIGDMDFKLPEEDLIDKLKSKLEFWKIVQSK